MLTKKYQLINNAGGWLVFAIALVTYWLTLEPTASYWDCGEFIIQADKLEIGHPPGNPIFMLTARFFANFATSAQTVSVMVNAMSGLLSALTILLLFWTITHLVRRLVVKDGQRKEPSLQQYLAIMGSGLVGSLAYCWSDTFWFSAVEGEVYAFSSFCTALVFWLILKWENRADEPHSDRYLILIAYIIGVSVAVHLLNLLCIPAIVLVFAYRKWKDMDLVKSLITLAVSFVIIFVVLYGLVPGFIKVAQQFELLFVNGFHLSFNSGAIAYAFVMAAIFIWTLRELYAQKSPAFIKVAFLLSVACSGALFIGSSFLWGWILIAALAAWLFSRWARPLPVRVLTVITWSMAVIFVGYSSYALILIRSTADTPMNQNSPDNVFDLASYLNREQYGENPLLYGETLYSSPQKTLEGTYTDTVTYYEGSPVLLSSPAYSPVVEAGKPLYAKGVKGAVPQSDYNFLSEGEKGANASLAARGGDYYVKRDYKPEPKMNPELNMLFPRLYSRQHRDLYSQWVSLDTAGGSLVAVNAIDRTTGEKVPELDTSREPAYNQVTGVYSYPQKFAFKPGWGQNLSYFINYQLNHMYLRYFMWNFAGRQNDILNQSGEVDAGNWISGIPMIDNPRLGDQSLLPDDIGKDNQGHNVYYMLPLILGIIGLLWQSFAGKRGIEQFWVVFFLFFMTGIAIVLYLNQTPGQPRERDYAFAGSFYAYAIWIGMGVAGLWRCLLWILDPARKNRKRSTEADEQVALVVDEPARLSRASRYAAVAACIIGIAVPLQIVSQTWDDHDRSGRFAARDFAINYLESLEPNAIVFCNGDNDTFPLWYVQEVEGVRPDVRIINLSYLNSDWYANQLRQQAYDSAPVAMTATPADYAYGRSDVALLGNETAPADLLSSLRIFYEAPRTPNSYPQFPSAVISVPVDRQKVIERGLVPAGDEDNIADRIVVNLRDTKSFQSKGYLSLGEILMLDIIATNAANGWPRPIYWVTTVGTEYHLGFTPYLRSTGMAHQLTPTVNDGVPSRTDRAFDVVTKKYRWGGADTQGSAPYYDETARRMLLTTRSSMLDVVSECIYEGDRALTQGDSVKGKADYGKALQVLSLIEKRLGEKTAPYGLNIASTMAEAYCELGDPRRLNDSRIKAKGVNMFYSLIERYAPYLPYSRELAMTFGNPALLLETRYVPYQMHRMIEVYTQNGGDVRKVDALLKRYGSSSAELKSNYNKAYSSNAYGDYVDSGVGAGQADQTTLASYVAEIEHYAEIVNELTGLSPEQYAARSDQERLIDSMFMSAVDFYIEAGGKEEDLRSKPNFSKVDMQRSRRLADEFTASHPELTQQ